MWRSLSHGVACLLACALWAPDARAADAPVLLRRTHYFEVYLLGTSAAAHPRLLAGLDAGAARVAAHLGRPFPASTRLVLTGSRGDFDAALPAGVHLPETVQGVAFSELRLMVLRNSPRMEQTFLHEASHIALLAATAPTRPPAWFIEGFAAYQAEESPLERQDTLVRAAVSDRLIPLRELDAHFPLHGAVSELAYAQSNEMVAYLLGTYGRARFAELVSRLARQQPFFTALETTYGQPLAALERAYVRDLRQRFHWLPVVTGTTALYLVVTLVFLAAYARKRAQTRRRLLAMAEEDDQESDGPPYWLQEDLPAQAPPSTGEDEEGPAPAPPAATPPTLH